MKTRRPLEVVGTLNTVSYPRRVQTFGEGMGKFDGFFQRRLDGRVELTCKHGIGHPSEKLQSREWSWTDGVHGCDGCCDDESFEVMETNLALGEDFRSL